MLGRAGVKAGVRSAREATCREHGVTPPVPGARPCQGERSPRGPGEGPGKNGGGYGGGTAPVPVGSRAAASLKHS